MLKSGFDRYRGWKIKILYIRTIQLSEAFKIDVQVLKASDS
jgi:hypothetical protein